MDPQQRIFLELCWECMERAGHVPDATPFPVGVFAGMHNASYTSTTCRQPELVAKLGAFQVMLDNEKDYIATRVGTSSTHGRPSASTSLFHLAGAVCQAIESLRAGAAHGLAGGIRSPARCATATCTRPGDALADGTQTSTPTHRARCSAMGPPWCC